ncbi:MAG: AAA family ATPase [Oscillospiraceae bacterium]|nr:AAA family ATPase [Oscillospiraceae bacterium]
MRLGIKDNEAESGNVIAVFSTKGGTGKTTVAVNLAASLAKSGRRVALIDLDLQFGDVGVFMNISKSDTISDLIEEGDFSPDAVTGYLYKHSCGVHALCAPGSPEQADLITPEHIEAVISSVKNGYEYVILDLPPILDDNSIASIEQADHIWFITNPEISTLKNTKVCMDILRSLDLEDKIRIVLNKDGDAIISKDKVKSVLLSEIELSIPYDFKTAVTAVNRGKPFVISDPHAKVSKAFEKYVKSLDEAK